MPEAKTHVIPKQLVWEAYQRVKANRGAAGVDGETLAAYEKDLKGNLYKVWNRMSSGSYFPSPVRLVEIPKENGGMRPLGIPTVGRSGRADGREDGAGALGGTQVPRGLVWLSPRPVGAGCGGNGEEAMLGADWVIDLDIRAFFDSIPHELVERAVAHHTSVIDLSRRTSHQGGSGGRVCRSWAYGSAGPGESGWADLADWVERVCKPDCLWRRQGRLRPVARGPLLVQAGPGGHVSGKRSCWGVGERRVTLRW